MSGMLNVLMATTDEGGGGGGGGSFQATASPVNLTGFVVGSFGGTVVTSEPAIATTMYGVAPLTYSWTRTSGSTSIYPETPLASHTYFATTFPGGSNSRAATFKCTVTDAASNVVDTNTVDVLLILETIHIGGGAIP